MATVGSANRVDAVDLQLMVNASAMAQPQAQAPSSSAVSSEPDARISSAGRLRSATSAVLDAAHQLNQASTWQATRATSDNAAVVQAVSDGAAAGEHTVAVESVAKGQITSSPTFSSLGTLVGIGTLKIELGSWNSSMSTFATNPNWPKASVSFGPKDTTMEEIRDRINAAGVGVIAVVVSDATGSRLVLRSTMTGSDNGFRVTAESPSQASQETAQALAALGFDPAASASGSNLVQSAQDARLSIDGRVTQSSQNLVNDPTSGLTLLLQGQEGAQAHIRVEADVEGLHGQIQAFAHAYNNMVTQLAQTPASEQGGSAQTARTIQQRVESAFSFGSRAGTLGGQLKAVGLQLDAQGQLQISADRLNHALQVNPQRVGQLFDASDAGSGAPGLTARLQDIQLSDLSAAAATSAAASPAAPAQPTAAGAQFRQRLLEQYASASSSGQEDELTISANEA